MNSISFLRLVMKCVLLAVFVVNLAIAQEPSSKPNILLIVVDDMGYGDVSVQGSKQIATPNIDRLAGAGVRFTQGYVSGTVCAPSRAGLMTGRYPNRFGFEHNLAYTDYMPDEQIALPKDEKTMADFLKAAGYRTGLVGKWHLGDSAEWHHPNARGFDFFFGMLNGNHNYFPKPDKNHLFRQREPVTEIRVPYLTDWFTQEAMEFIETGPAAQPWFLFLSYNTPHTPLQAKEEDIARFAHIKDRKRRIYCAMQYCLDENIGRLMAWLQEKQMWDNTLIVFMSDNGGPCASNASVNAPLRGQKGILLEGGSRVPMFMIWPNKIPAKKTYDQPVISLDLLPTFLAAAGGEAWPPKFAQSGNNRRNRNKAKIFDGVDLMPFLLGSKADQHPHDTLYWRLVLRGGAIRDGDWKLIRLPHRPSELYNLAADISETNDLAEKHPERVIDLLSKLHDWELTFESNPKWISAVHWAKHNRELYDREYLTEQPE